MDSIEILERYLTGQAGRKETRQAFDELLAGLSGKEKIKARYAYGTFLCYTMYKGGAASGGEEGTVSAREFLIKLRDLILFDRRVQCGATIAELVEKMGTELGLYCDQHGYVNANLILPAWFANKAFVENTYRLTDCRKEEAYGLGDDYLTQAVKKFNVYKSFEIKVAVHSALNLPDGYTFLASLPTGAGKSLVTQMVAYYSEGLTIVVVPTVALAIDQYAAAIETLQDDFADRIYYYRGEQSDEEYERIIAGIKEKKARLLFISPEALLKNTALNNLLDKCAANGFLKNVVVDEAHIVPDWGILFRPDFQILSFAMKRWRQISKNKVRTFLLSATLPDDTVEVLKHLFAPEGKILEYRCDALRREPQFCFYETKSINKRWDAVEELIETLPKPMIVYFLEPAEVMLFQKRMKEKGFRNIRAFHGETKDTERAKILNDWKADKCDVILATSAFGIGVDKANVRTVVHACVPENLSRFYQEVGRAGRDGLSSLSVLLPYSGKENKGSDSEKAYGLVRGRVLRVETMVNRWKGMRETALVQGDTIDVDSATVPPYFTEEAAEYAGERNSGWNINLLLFLHRIEFIDILDATYRIETKSYHFHAKVLKVEELSDDLKLSQALEEPRENELRVQLDGYQRMREIVMHPERRCWGASFHRLYPLSDDCCNGCPKHERDSRAMDEQYRIRKKIDYLPNPCEPTESLWYAMRSYTSLIVRNETFPEVEKGNLLDVVLKINQAGVRTIVGDEATIKELRFRGLKLTYNEFFFMVSMYPGFFSSGVLALFNENEYNNSVLFDNVTRITDHGYRAVLYCSDDMYIRSRNRRITDFLNCKIRNVSDLI